MKRLLLIALGLGMLAGCSAAPAPCLIQRPPLGGYGNQFTIKTATAGCPDVFGDNLRWDKYTDNLVVAKSDAMPYSDRGGDPDPTHSPLGQGNITDAPDASGNCSVATVSEMRSDDTSGVADPPGPRTYNITNMVFLDGARYQGSTYKADVHVVFGACEADYTTQAITPNVPCTVDDDCNPLAEPDKGRAVGSGLNPDYATACNFDAWTQPILASVFGIGPADGFGLCFFTKPFPGLK